VQLNGERLSEDDIGKSISAEDVIKLGKKKFVRFKR